MLHFLHLVIETADYKQKRVGLGPLFQPSGDIERDMAAIKAYYAPLRGKNAQQFDPD